jgi:GMP synthase (glutamine-hydrolysing)
MRRAVVIEHVAFENLGTFRTALVEAGFTIEILQAGVADLRALDPVEPDLLIVLGGPIGVYENDDYPFLIDEIDVLAKRLASKRPTVGICLGAQLMAAALGAQVSPGTRGKEIGWAPIFPAEGAKHQVILDALFSPELRVLHWHGDTFQLPPYAAHLAGSARYANQAFSIGDFGLALQFHAEVRADTLEPWYIGHAVELARAQISIPQLRADGQRYARALEHAAHSVWRAWLDLIYRS